MVPLVIKAHHGRRYRDTSLFLDLHPVARRGLADLVRLHRTRYMDRTAVQQQLLCQRRLTRIRVRDDRKSPTSQYFLLISGG